MAHVILSVMRKLAYKNKSIVGLRVSQLSEEQRRRMIRLDPERYLRLIADEILAEMPEVAAAQIGKAKLGMAGCAAFLKSMVELGRQKTSHPRKEQQWEKSVIDRGADLIPSCNLAPEPPKVQ